MGVQEASRPTPTASGTLARTPFVHLLLYALDRRLSGSLEVSAPDRQSATIVFVDGRPAKARTSNPVAHLGRVLLELGHIDQAQLDRSLAELARAKTAGPRLHGEVLLASGLIDDDRLRQGLEEQLARRLRRIAAMAPETGYAYYDGRDSLQGWGGPARQGIDPYPLLWAMVRESPASEHVDAALARVAASSLRLHAGDGLERLRLGKHELAAVEVLRSRPLRPAEVARSTGLEERTAQLLTYLLLLTRQVDVVTAPAAAPSAPPAGAQPSAELASRRREILERAAAIDSQDYFDMLGLARDATTEQVEAAYFEAAKRWHPDRLPPELASVRDACTRIFARIGEARVTLADESARARYLKVAADGGGSPQAQEAVARVVEAATQFQKAEVCFKRNDLAQAETFCRRAHELDPTQPDYLALLAWLVATKVPDKAQSCIAMLDRAVAMSDRCEKAFFWRGMLHKRLGRVEQAMRDFERAAEINPRNIDALREVRLHQMRGGARGSKKG